MNDKLLSIEEAAERLGRTPMAMYRLVERRQIPFRKSGRRVFFVERELQDFIDGLPGVTPEEARERAGANA